MMGSGSATGENRARAAAEAAVSSPLLEDVNLSGAHGLLINVTAGMDLRTSEFHVVGDTVKQYASEDATVVVGYVIDPDMTDQIRVTVVATGIGRPTAVRGMPAGMLPPQGRSRSEPCAPSAARQLCGLRPAELPAPPRAVGDGRACRRRRRRLVPRHTRVSAPAGRLRRSAQSHRSSMLLGGPVAMPPWVLTYPAERSRHAQATHAEEHDPGHRGRSAHGPQGADGVAAGAGEFRNRLPPHRSR